MIRKSIYIVAVFLIGLVALAGCTGDRSSRADPVVVTRVSGEQFVDRVTADDIVLDVRTPGEFAGGHVVGAVNVDFRAPNFGEQVAALDRDKTYYLYCRSGNRSSQAQRLMKGMGFTSVIDAGGFSSLARAGAPTAR